MAWFAVMGYFGMFTKLASLRGDALLSSPTASLAQHARILLLLGGILVQAASYIATYAGSMGAGSARQAAAAAAAEGPWSCWSWLPNSLVCPSLNVQCMAWLDLPQAAAPV
jgi:hypothetical protein